MPYTLKPNKFFAKDPNGDGYLPQNVVTDKATEDVVAEIQAAGVAEKQNVSSEGTRQINAIQSKVDSLSDTINAADAKIAEINSAGTAQVNAVNAAGKTQTDAIDAKTDEIDQKISDASSIIDRIDAAESLIAELGSLIDLVHPVGSIYISVSNEKTPDQMFGGTWEQIKDRFLLTAGDTYHVGDADGGEATHTLTESELPEMHKKMVFRRIYGSEKSDGSGRNEYAIHIATGSEGVTNEIVDANVSGPIVTSGTYNPGKTQMVSINIGGDQAHNNMPPYTIVYAWKRIA